MPDSGSGFIALSILSQKLFQKDSLILLYRKLIEIDESKENEQKT